MLWRFGTGESSVEAQRTAALEACSTAIDIADSMDTDHASFAEDAAAAIAYGLQTMVTDDPKVATWAAQRAYDSVDRVALMRMDEDGVEWTEEEILCHPAIQRELTRQWDTLDFLRATGGTARLSRDDIAMLREAAQQQAQSMFSDYEDENHP